MKKLIYFLLSSIPLFSGCKPSINAWKAFNVAGIYQLIRYSSTPISDDNPGGTLEATQVDEDHINLVVKGQSRKTKFNYSYANVLVSPTGNNNTGESNYSLIYKKRVIGLAHIDGGSRYVVLTPSSSLRIEGIEL